VETRSSGAEGGPGKQTRRNSGTAPRPDPYLVGRAGKTAMGTLVERTSRYLIPVPLPTGKQAEGLKDALLTVAADLPAHLLRSLTWDCGCGCPELDHTVRPACIRGAGRRGSPCG